MKSNGANVNNVNNVKLARIRALSMVTVMGLSLTGQTLHASSKPFWKVDEKGKASQLVESLTVPKAKDAVELLVTTPDFREYVEQFSSEPTQFLEGVRKSILSLSADAEKSGAFTATLVEIFKAVPAKVFSTQARKEAFIAALEKLAKIDSKDLAGMTRAEFLEAVLSDKALLAALGLTDTKEEVVAEKKKEAKKEDTEGDELVASNEPTVPFGPVGSVVPQSTVGEVSDESLRARAQVICDKFNEVVSQGNEQFQNLSNSFRELINRFKGISEVPAAQVAQKNTPNEDTIGPLLKALGKGETAQVAAAPAAPVVAPTQTASEETPNRNSVLDNPLPQPQQPQVAQMPFFATPQATGNRPQIALDLPSNRGTRDLRTAREAVSVAEDSLRKQVPGLTNQFGMQNNPLMVVSELGALKAETNNALASVDSAQKLASDRLATLDSQLEQLKEGGRAALPEWVKKEQARLTQLAEAAKSSFEQQRQQLSQQGQVSGEQSATVGGLSLELQRANAALAEFNADVEAKVETGNKAIASMKSQRDSLEESLSGIRAQKTKLENRITQITSVEGQAGQAYLASQQQGQGNAGPNVNRIAGSGARAGRSNPIANSLSTNAPATGVRGALGGNQTPGRI
jgi:hypothetical protein